MGFFVRWFFGSPRCILVPSDSWEQWNHALTSDYFVDLLPAVLFFGGSAFIYAKTRLPAFLHDKHVAFMVLSFAPLAFLPYYDSSLLDIDKSLADFIYMGVYWLLSMVWVGVGVLFIILRAIQGILKGLIDPYGEM